MILALCLLLVAAVVATVGPRVLPRVTSGRSPLASIAAWQVASWSVVAGVGLAAALVASPSLVSLGHLPNGLESCLVVLRHGTAPESPVVQVPSVLILAGVVARLVTCAVRTDLDSRRRRTQHRDLLTLVGRLDRNLGVSVIDDSVAVVYCLPGHGGTVVFTSSALNRLSNAQRVAVLAHERAHLCGRHHLLMAGGSLLAVAFPRVRLFRDATEHTARLIEMRADDVAARRHGRRSVAEALFVLSDVASPAIALAATGISTAQRVERLLANSDVATSSRIGRATRTGGALVGYGVFAASPALLAIAGHAALCLV